MGAEKNTYVIDNIGTSRANDNVGRRRSEEVPARRFGRKINNCSEHVCIKGGRRALIRAVPRVNMVARRNTRFRESLRILDKVFPIATLLYPESPGPRYCLRRARLRLLLLGNYLPRHSHRPRRPAAVLPHRHPLHHIRRNPSCGVGTLGRHFATRPRTFPDGGLRDRLYWRGQRLSCLSRDYGRQRVRGSDLYDVSILDGRYRRPTSRRQCPAQSHRVGTGGGRGRRPRRGLARSDSRTSWR